GPTINGRGKSAARPSTLIWTLNRPSSSKPGSATTGCFANYAVVSRRLPWQHCKPAQLWTKSDLNIPLTTAPKKSETTPRNPRNVGYIFGFLLALFLVYMIYRRKNWARWIYAGCVVIWLVTLVVHLRFLTRLNIIGGLLLAVQLALWWAAAFMLFVPAANDWFRTHRK